MDSLRLDFSEAGGLDLAAMLPDQRIPAFNELLNEYQPAFHSGYLREGARLPLMYRGPAFWRRTSRSGPESS